MVGLRTFKDETSFHTIQAAYPGDMPPLGVLSTVVAQINRVWSGFLGDVLSGFLGDLLRCIKGMGKQYL